MAHLHQRDPTAPRIRPLSAEILPVDKHSIFYSMLPSAVQRRLPRLPSIHRSVSMYGLANRRQSVDWKPNSKSSVSSGARTPEAGYISAMILSGSNEVENYFTDGMSSDEEPPQSKDTNGMELTETKSGIGWKFANQGLNLLSLAVDESSTISHDPTFGNASFARQVYIHALTYLLRALPSDMTTEEQLSIRSALPHGVVEPLHVEVHPYINHPRSSSQQQPSLLHRTLASGIVQLFILFQFVLPYLKYLLSAAYQYDREHKISEKVLSQSIETIDVLGKTGIGLTSSIYEMGDGKVGQVITETAAWFVEGVTGGIHDGVGEGMVLMGAAPRRTGSERK